MKKIKFKLPDDASTARLVEELESLDFLYHTFHFDGGLSARGDYDISIDIDSYPFPENIDGMKILDVGIGSGWLSIYLKMKGADVTSFDARGLCDMDIFGQHVYGDLETEKCQPNRIGKDGTPIWNNRTSDSFFIVSKALGLDIPFKSGKIYDLPEIFSGEKFDLVFVGNLLIHLRDPIGALCACRQVCRNRLIATNKINSNNMSETPIMMMPFTGFSKRAWWVPNLSCYEKWFLAANFSKVDVSKQLMMTADVIKEHVSGNRNRNDSYPLQVADCLI